jgi:putative phosphoesterase
MRIGLISDTHGLLRPQALNFLRGCDQIVHGGDIGTLGVLEALARLAPLTAVRGNVDHGAWADALPEVAQARLSGVLVVVLHDLAQLDLDPAAAGVRVVVSGHSHKPRIEQREGVWYVNPGSAGPRRFKLPVSVGELVIEGDLVRPRIHELS